MAPSDRTSHPPATTAPLALDSPPVPSTFGERLAFGRWWRMGMVERDLAEAGFAELVGVSAPALSQWRDKREAPRGGEHLRRVAQLCGVPSAWLVLNDGPPPALFRGFLKVYRAWVAQGGLKRGPATQQRNAVVAKRQERAKAAPPAPPVRTTRGRPVPNPAAKAPAKKKPRGA